MLACTFPDWVLLFCPGGTRYLSIRGGPCQYFGSEILQHNHIWGLFNYNFGKIQDLGSEKYSLRKNAMFLL